MNVANRYIAGLYELRLIVACTSKLSALNLPRGASSASGVIAQADRREFRGLRSGLACSERLRMVVVYAALIPH